MGAWAQARPEILIKICDTIRSQLDHWYHVRDKKPRRRESADLISASEIMTLSEKTLGGWILSIKNFGEIAIAEEAIEASTGGRSFEW